MPIEPIDVDRAALLAQPGKIVSKGRTHARAGLDDLRLGEGWMNCISSPEQLQHSPRSDPAGLFVLVGFLLDSLIAFTVFGVIGGALIAFIVFGRRARTAMYGEIEGQPGAAAAVVSSLRGDWRLTPNVAVTRNQDIVHRVVGKPGVILIGEGSGDRLGPLIADQQKRIGRVAAGTPVTVVLVGNEPGQVPLAKLERKLTRLPRTFKGATVDQIEGRMRALGGLNIPIPKGPLPKGMRLPKGVRPPR